MRIEVWISFKQLLPSTDGEEGKAHADTGAGRQARHDFGILDHRKAACSL